MKLRVQHPRVEECRDYKQRYWFFRYYADEIQSDGTVKTSRKRQACGPSKGPEAITRKQAEKFRDGFLHDLDVAPPPPAVPAAPPEPKAPDPGQIILGRLIDLWRKDYVDNPKVKLATPTREKYRGRLKAHILPRWKSSRLADLNDTKAVLDWLQLECSSWYMMMDLRNIMSGIVTRAQEWGIIPRSFANPMQWVKIGRKWAVRPDRILSGEETAQLFARLSDPHLLICETCISTGTRISEAVGLQLKHVDLVAGTIRIAQRNCRGDIDEPKTKNSKRTLALGNLAARYEAWIAARGAKKPDDWIFPQDEDKSLPMWDSGVRKALKLAARAVKPEGAPKNDPGLDFPGFGLHSFRRANITMRQEVGGSAIEASKIAGHATVNMTGDYTIVQMARQTELTCLIQAKLAKARTAEEGKHRTDNKADEAA